MLTLPFQILTQLRFNENDQLLQTLNRNLTEEENSSQCLKILTQITIEDESELAEREVFPKTINERVLKNLPSKAFLPFVVFFHKDKRRKDGNDFQTETGSGFQNTPALLVLTK